MRLNSIQLFSQNGLAIDISLLWLTIDSFVAKIWKWRINAQQNHDLFVLSPTQYT
jgi:hypothetical protein